MTLAAVLGSLALILPSVPLVLGAPSVAAQGSVIQRDIAIIGGGASGTYAAVRLKDSGKSVVVIEKASELGGNAETYTAPGGVRVNYGVSSFQNYTVVRDFFARYNIPLIPYARIGAGDKYANFATGQEVADTTIPVPDFGPYLAQLDKYPYLEYGWDLPQSVPEDLLMPFGQFVKKYNLQSVVYTLSLLAAGNGNLLEQTTVYVLKLVNRGYIEGVLGAGVQPARFDTHELYEKALAELGSNVLLSSTVVQGFRSDAGVRLVVQTPQGLRVIEARKLLFSAPPLLQNTQSIGLDAKERDVFSRFQHHALYVGLVNNTGLDEGYRYYNADPNATYSIPETPSTAFVWATKAKGIYWAWYNSPAELPESTVRSEIVAAVKRLHPNFNPGLVAYDSHTPSAVGVSANDIRSGFYNKLKTLQGYRSTYYIGAAWLADHSAALWNFTEVVMLPKLVT